jgi:hypothetical protein
MTLTWPLADRWRINIHQVFLAASIGMLRSTVTAMADESAPSLVAVRNGPVPLLLLVRVLRAGDRDSYMAASSSPNRTPTLASAALTLAGSTSS